MGDDGAVVTVDGQDGIPEGSLVDKFMVIGGDAREMLGCGTEHV